MNHSVIMSLATSYDYTKTFPNSIQKSLHCVQSEHCEKRHSEKVHAEHFTALYVSRPVLALAACIPHEQANPREEHTEPGKNTEQASISH